MPLYKILLCFLIFGPSILTAQKEDVHWIFSLQTQSTPGNIPGTHIRFDPAFSVASDTFQASCLGGCTNISDRQGDLLFFTNGINIYHPDGSVMPNGDHINPGQFHDDFASSGYPASQGAVILPTPGDTGSYHLFHVGIDDSGIYGGTGMVFYYSIVRRNPAGNGFYVSEKNHVILADTLGKGYITATKHANGRDWWLILPRIASNKYRVFLLTPAGIGLQNEQNIGYVTEWRDWSGQSVITPDGSKYIRFDQFNRLNIFDFDRCTGLLSHPVHIAHPFASPDSAVAGGVTVSPNSRYLYLSASAWVYQYDLAAADIAASRILVGEYDGTQLPLPTTFFRGQLGPDGQIYLNATNSNRSLHVIHQPDLAGNACGFENNGVTFDHFIYWAAMPYFPNYRLGALEGSGCDTLQTTATSGVPDNPSITVYPNPATAYVSFSWKSAFDADGTLCVYNAFQQPVYQAPRFDDGLKMDVRTLPPGMYYAVLFSGGKKLASTSFIVIK